LIREGYSRQLRLKVLGGGVWWYITSVVEGSSAGDAASGGGMGWRLECVPVEIVVVLMMFKGDDRDNCMSLAELLSSRLVNSLLSMICWIFYMLCAGRLICGFEFNAWWTSGELNTVPVSGFIYSLQQYNTHLALNVVV
jgi:hypothetical protein